VKKDGGYAMIAAIAGAAAFAFIAFETLATQRGVIANLRGQLENAQMRGAADAGVAAAIYGLGASDPQKRWGIDGRYRIVHFADMTLTVVVEDEHGKIPINRLDEDEVQHMFEVAGVKGPRLDQLVDTLQDWMDEDDDVRPNGAEAPDYVAQGIKPRNGDLESVGELALIKGMDKALYDKLAPSITVFFGETGSFSVEDAQPLALAVMSDEAIDQKNVMARSVAIMGAASPFANYNAQNLVGRPLTVRVTVRDPEGGTFQRSTIVELTGNAHSPYWVRYVD
jgi:general secretion pathway protein K